MAQDERALFQPAIKGFSSVAAWERSRAYGQSQNEQASGRAKDQETEDVLDVEELFGPKGAEELAMADFPVKTSSIRQIGSSARQTIGANLSKKKVKSDVPSNGLKKGTLAKAKKLDMPPTPLGCEWRETEDGWNLFRCWSEKDKVLGGRYRKERYAGYLSREAWQEMKQYDYETFISVIAQRFRRHSGR